MSYSGEAALSLVEALIEHLEAEGVLTAESIGAIYDRALALAEARTDSGARAGPSRPSRLWQ